MAGINGNELVGPFNVGYDMKRNSKTDCRLLNQYLIGSPKILPFAKLRFPILRQYKAPSHASKYTIRWLVHQGVLGKHIRPNLPPKSYSDYMGRHQEKRSMRLDDHLKAIRA